MNKIKKIHIVFAIGTLLLLLVVSLSSIPAYSINIGTGAEVRRFALHQMDLAQPSVRCLSGTVENNSRPKNTVVYPSIFLSDLFNYAKYRKIYICYLYIL